MAAKCSFLLLCLYPCVSVLLARRSRSVDQMPRFAAVMTTADRRNRRCVLVGRRHSSRSFARFLVAISYIFGNTPQIHYEIM